MPARQLIFHEAARDKIRRGVDILADAVKVTLGPRGRTVILERDFGAPQVVNSGVLVAKSVELEDRFENMGAQLLREVAARTSEKAGDGTTTATVLAHAMIHEGLRYLAGGMNPMDLKRGMERAIEAVVAELKLLSRPCASSQEIAHVAAISANNDASIGALLAGAIDKVGREGATLGRTMPRGRIQQEGHGGVGVLLAHAPEKQAERRLLHVRTSEHHPMPRPQGHRPKQDAFGVVARNRHPGLLPPQRPGTAEHGKEPQHGLILTQEDRRGRQVPELADYGPFFCARWGAFSSEK